MDQATLRDVVRFFRAVDTRDWRTVRDLLADEVTLDYVSVFGGEVETIPADDVVTRWQALLPGFDATQHVLGALAGIDGTIQGNVRGHHVLGDDEWMVAGWYRLRIDGRRLAAISLTLAYETGSRDLLARATERAARQPA